MINTLLLLAATYTNPVLHMDFSDPDVCTGKDGKAYMTASSFGALPGLPILTSDDLVNWSYVGYALEKHPFGTEEGDPQHGNAVWAPAIRYRADKDEYVIYWGDPDRGAYRVSAKSPTGPWSEPRLVIPAKGLIDTCPLYDDDGRIYLVNGWANSRAGMNSVLTVRELDAGETHQLLNFTTSQPLNFLSAVLPSVTSSTHRHWVCSGSSSAARPIKRPGRHRMGIFACTRHR